MQKNDINKRNLFSVFPLYRIKKEVSYYFVSGELLSSAESIDIPIGTNSVKIINSNSFVSAKGRGIAEDVEKNGF